MKKLLLLSFLFATMFAFRANAIGVEAIVITSPIQYQTVYSPEGMLKINYRVNATTLFVIPEDLVLYINGIEQKRIRVNSSRYFNINGMPEGKFTIMIAAFAHDKRMVAMSQEITFNMRHDGFKTAGK